jgi:alkyl sulfatase BDS1-like metallo-beta-lactamase superfamily hydrolase
VKAVYQRYMGWFDGNPSNLHSLPQEEAAIKYFSYMGGLESILPKAVSDYEEGQYRWVSEVLKHVVALPLSYQARLDQTRLTEARNLLADSLEQQGYQAEAATWRNFFLMGAQELRGPIKKIQATGSAFLDALETEMCFDALAVQISPEKFFKAQKKSKTKPFSVVLRWNFTYTSSQNKPEFVQVSVENAALNYLQYTTVQSTWGTPTTPYITVPRDDFNALLTNIAAAASNNTNPQNIISDFFSNKDTQITPPASLQDVQSTLTCFFGLLGKSDPSFPIVTPQRPHAATD